MGRRREGGRDGAVRSKMGAGEMAEGAEAARVGTDGERKHDGIGSKLEGDKRIWAVVGRPLVSACFDSIGSNQSSIFFLKKKAIIYPGFENLMAQTKLDPVIPSNFVKFDKIQYKSVKF
jgi:hypothetical protein